MIQIVEKGSNIVDAVRAMMGTRAMIQGKVRKVNVIGVLENQKTGAIRLIAGHNLVTNDGDQYYAEAAAGSPSWAVAGMRLGTSASAATKTDTDVTTVDTAGNCTILHKIPSL